MAHRGRKNADDVLALAIAQGKTWADASTLANVSARTVARRQDDPTFRRRIDHIRADMVHRAVGKMADGMVEAAETLRALLKAKSEAIRLSAARAILELSCKLRESTELAAKVAELEQKLLGIKADEPERQS